LLTLKPLIFSSRIPDLPSSLFASRRPRDFINFRFDSCLRLLCICIHYLKLFMGFETEEG
ncbi:unnamed protein product, partial [Brassica napus]